MAEGHFHPRARARIPMDPFGEQSLTSRFMDDQFTMPSFPDDLSMDWPAWARSRLGSPFSSGLRSSFPRTSVGAAPGGASRYSDPPDTPGDPWKVCVNVNSFKPEEISIKTKDGYVEVSGKHEEKQNEGGTVTKSFNKRIQIPGTVDPLAVFASLSPEGVLIIEAPHTPPYYLFSRDAVGTKGGEPEPRVQETPMA